MGSVCRAQDPKNEDQHSLLVILMPTRKSSVSLTFSILEQDALGSVTGLHYDSKYFRIAKENGELCMVSGSLNITMICPRFS